jgi:hypothetical protein
MEKNKIYMPKNFQWGIKYLIENGERKSILLIKNVDRDGNPTLYNKVYPCYSGICKAKNFEKSNKKLVLTEKICKELTNLYKTSTNEKIFFLGGYAENENLMIKDMFFPEIINSSETKVNLKNPEQFFSFYLRTQLKNSLLGKPVIFVGHNHTNVDSLHEEKDRIIHNLSLVDCYATTTFIQNLEEKQNFLTKILPACQFGTVMINKIGDITAVCHGEKLKTIDKVFCESKKDINNISSFRLNGENPLGVFRDYEKNYDIQSLPSNQDKILDSIMNAPSLLEDTIEI